MKIGLIICSFCVSLAVISAQQSPQYTQHMFNKYRFNSAYAGFDRSLSVTGANRTQWSVFDGAPTSVNVNAHLPFYIWNGGLGINLENDKTGALSASTISFSYNYVYDSPIGLFSASARFGVVQSRLNGQDLITPDGIYEGGQVEHNDAILPNRAASGISPIWGLSAYYIGDFFETGISMSDVPKHTSAIGSLDIERQALVNWYLEANYPVTNAIELMPSIFIKTDFVQTQVDIAGIAKYRNQYFGGLGFRGYNANSVDALVLYVGFKFNRKYRLTYSYDLGINGLRQYHDGTHEFVLNYNLQKLIGLGLPPKVIYNPRFL